VKYHSGVFVCVTLSPPFRRRWRLVSSLQSFATVVESGTAELSEPVEPCLLPMGFPHSCNTYTPTPSTSRVRTVPSIYCRSGKPFITAISPRCRTVPNWECACRPCSVPYCISIGPAVRLSGPRRRFTHRGGVQCPGTEHCAKATLSFPAGTPTSQRRTGGVPYMKRSNAGGIPATMSGDLTAKMVQCRVI
jgi:hypothetical protein